MQQNTDVQSIFSSIMQIKKQYEDWAEEEGFNLCTVQFYYTLVSKTSVTQNQFCEMFGIPKTSVNKVVSNLKEDGIIEIEISVVDKREKKIRLNDESRQCVLDTLAPLFTIENRVKEKMGEKKMQELVTLISDFNDFLEIETKRYKSAKENS